MTPDDVERAAFLMRAKKGILEMRDESKRTEPTPYSGDCRGVQITVGDYSKDESGGSIDAWAYFDLTVGSELIDFAEGLVDRELAALGVQMDTTTP